MNISLWGFMGAGKSTIGRRLAEAYHYQWLDSDQYIENQEGMSIAKLFNQHGELYFRQRETLFLQELVKKSKQGELLQPILLTTGGGMPISAENRKLLKELGTTIFIHVPFAEITKRLMGDSGRPLWKGEELEVMEQRYFDRLPYYLEADLVIEADGLSANEVTEMIVKKLKNI